MHRKEGFKSNTTPWSVKCLKNRVCMNLLQLFNNFCMNNKLNTKSIQSATFSPDSMFLHLASGPSRNYIQVTTLYHNFTAVKHVGQEVMVSPNLLVFQVEQLSLLSCHLSCILNISKLKLEILSTNRKFWYRQYSQAVLYDDQKLLQQLELSTVWGYVLSFTGRENYRRKVTLSWTTHNNTNSNRMCLWLEFLAAGTHVIRESSPVCGYECFMKLYGSIKDFKLINSWRQVIGSALSF